MNNANPSDGGGRNGSSPSSNAGLPAELVTLLNTLLTCVAGLVLTVLFQYSLVLLWRHCFNRKYYRMLREDQHEREHAAKKRGGKEAPAKSPVKFFPYPKSLIWPTPLFFTCCIFVMVRYSPLLSHANVQPLLTENLLSCLSRA